MKESKLLNTLKLFSIDELELISHFLLSPEFKSNKHQKEHCDLFEYLRNYLNGYGNVNIEKKQVYAFLFPKTDEVKGKLEKLMSNLLKQIYAFIGMYYREGKGDLLNNMITLVDFFYKLNLRDKESSQLEKVKAFYDSIPQKNKETFYKGFLISEQQIRENYLLQNKKGKAFNFEKILEPLDVFYFLNKLEYACFFLSMDRFRKPIDKIENLINTIEQLKLNFKSSPILEIPLIQLYIQAYHLLKNINDEEYWKLRTMLEEQESEISKDVLRILMGIVRNYVVRQYNLGEGHFLDEFFKLNKTHIEKGYLDFDKGILQSSFTNMVNIGLRNKKFKWVFKFLNDYRNKIVGAKNPEEIYNLNLAAYQFCNMEYDLALDLLEEQYEHLYYKILAKRLELKIYYETKAPMLDSRIDAYKIYIYRLPKSQILDRQRLKETNFVNFIRRLNNPKTNFSIERIDKLISKIHSTKVLSERIWLLEKLENLKK